VKSKDKNEEITLEPKHWMIIKKKQVPFIKLKGKEYNGAHFELVSEKPLEVAPATLDSTFDKSLPAKTLGQYIHARGGKVTTWLPKTLYQAAMKPEKLEEKKQ
jgi:hypothetical protein